MDTDSQHVGCYETRKSPPSLEAIVRIAEALNISIRSPAHRRHPPQARHTAGHNLGDSLTIRGDLPGDDFASYTCWTPSSPITGSTPSLAASAD